ncbi:MAG: hypothetical protein LBS14_01840 [Holosporaceae bacterium]|jgi:hypothetical protein|nr:hypothetical protein [Holosporaceae bacterium]
MTDQLYLKGTYLFEPDAHIAECKKDESNVLDILLNQRKSRKMKVPEMDELYDLCQKKSDQDRIRTAGDRNRLWFSAF